MSDARLGRLRVALQESRVDALIVHRPVNIRYLTAFPDVFDAGFSGLLVVAPDRAVLVTDPRYDLQVREKAHGAAIEVLTVIGDPMPALAELLSEVAPDNVALEDTVSVSARDKMEKAFGRQASVTSGVVEAMRAVKDEEEIEAIVAAARLTDEALAHVLPGVSVGASTRDISLEIEWFMRTHGAQAAAFEFIVAAGARSAMPHARLVDQKISAGDFVKIDIGAVVGDYYSDMTRTFVAGKVDDEHRRVYEAVLEAQSRALAAVRAGVGAAELDAVARDHLAKTGYGPNFGHGLGHGVGLEVHERPTLSKTSKDVLAAGMVVTVEPGAYMPGFGGVRIEDLVVVEEAGARNLTSSPKELLVV